MDDKSARHEMMGGFLRQIEDVGIAGRHDGVHGIRQLISIGRDLGIEHSQRSGFGTVGMEADFPFEEEPGGPADPQRMHLLHGIQARSTLAVGQQGFDFPMASVLVELRFDPKRKEQELGLPQQIYGRGV